VELAIFAVQARFVKDSVEILSRDKGTKAFIILSAGFSETGAEGKRLESEIAEIIDARGGSLIGPNCIGVLTPGYHGVFAGPIPRFDPLGCDFASGSGATAVFILEKGMSLGLTFSSLFSVGNSARIGVEDVVRHWDESFDPEKSSRIKLLYLENIEKPDLLLRHASSLIRKGCRIAGVKAGCTEAGSRAASSHTGALASPDTAVEALFRKAGIVRCRGREDLVLAAAVFTRPPMLGKSVAVVTHAGGPGVMLTDALSQGGLQVPKIEGPAASELLARLHPGSSVQNPIDFLATGTAEHLGLILDSVETRMPFIDGTAVIFGDPGLFDTTPVMEVLLGKMKACRRPIYPIFPSLITARAAIDYFTARGGAYFSDEVSFARALSNCLATPPPAGEGDPIAVDEGRIRSVVEKARPGYLPPGDVAELLDAAGIDRAEQMETASKEEALSWAARSGGPLAMKVVGPVHKSEIGGVSIGVAGGARVGAEFDRLMALPGAQAVLLQPMLSGRELFVGAKREGRFGHVLLCGLGGIFIEVLKDVSCALAPVGPGEALSMIRSLKGRKIIEGTRGQEGVDEAKFAQAVARVSRLLQAAPEISELDLNPLLGTRARVAAVDARIRVGERS
jgi:acetyltransferase